jgi:hypothetical protein
MNDFNNETKFEASQVKALVPILPINESKGKKYRKAQKTHIFYTKLYLLFFFVGACAFAMGKVECKSAAETVVSYLVREIKDFPNFCTAFFPLILSSFLVYASGFTVYCPLATVIYSSTLFFVCGVSSGCILVSFGMTIKTFGILGIIGLFCIFCVFFCAVSVGISKIASQGINRLRISDGLLYSLLYWGYVFAMYFLFEGVGYILKV